MEWGAPPVYLIEKEGLDYDEYNLKDRSIIKKITKSLVKVAKIIKAVFSVREKVVLVDIDLHKAKKPFGQAHELGHHAIPEHREILYVCSEADLSYDTRMEMEFEANVFASEILFPRPLIEKIYENYPLTMETILHLAELANASIHSAALRYAEDCDKECCVLFLKVAEDGEGNKGLRLMSQKWSPAWGGRFRRKLIKDKQFFHPGHILSQIVFSGGLNDVIKGKVNVKNGKELMFQAHTFYNGYTVFALLF
jgi:Zn-dependent peptidase ImmA (M78 family)